MTRVAGWLALLSLVGCDCTGDSRGQRGAQCDLNSDCDAPLVCRLELCRVECATTRDCAAGLQCVLDADGFGACQLPEETRCSRASDCPDPLVCANRRCVNMCVMDRDCPPGAHCIEGGCIDEAIEACVRDSDCSPSPEGEPRVCGTDLRCRPGCETDRECRLGTACAPDRICRHRCRIGTADCSGLGACVDILMSGTFWCDPRVDGGVPFDAGPSLDAGPDLDSGPMACPLMSNAIAIVAGEDDSCALVASGEVWCWGDNFYRELGLPAPPPGGLRAHPDPVRVPGVSGAVAITGGFSHTCARLADGSLRCWGHNFAGELGDPSVPTGPLASSGAVTVAGTVARDVSAGAALTCALDAAGAATCWGDGTAGARGDGTTSTVGATPRPVVPPVPASGLDWIVAGGQNGFAFDGLSLWVWGTNDFGALGIGTTTDTPTPTSAMLPFVPAQLDSISDHTCAIDTSGRLWCWGADHLGQLGDGTPDPGTPLAQLVPGIGLARAVGTGTEHTCVLEERGVLCWGANFQGQLGNAMRVDVVDATRATPVLGLPARIDDLAVGATHACIRSGGDVWCWGRNFAGEVGIPPTPADPATGACQRFMDCAVNAAVRVPCLP